MKTKEMIEWLEDAGDYFRPQASSLKAEGYKDDEIIAAIIKSLQHYDTLKEDYDRLSNIIDGIGELVDSSFTDHPV